MSSQGSGSYRDSHRAKGQDYHQIFSTHPHLAMIWRMERSRLLEILDRWFAERAPDHLDFACGTGRVLAHLRSRTQSSVGVDLSASMLEVARGLVRDAELIEADLTRDDVLGERRFDLITAFRFFPNAEPELRSEAMGVLVRHLRPGGCLVFNNHENRSSLLRRVARGLGRTGPRSGRPPSAQQSMSREEIRELVAVGGLRIVEELPIAVLPFSDRHMLHPAWLLEAVERGLGRLPGAASLAQNLIYACRWP